MSDLDQVKGLIAQGNKEKAIAQLAALLLENQQDVEAWLLLGDIIDDPSRKKTCYRWVLRLSPNHSLALTKLQELETPPGDQIAIPEEAESGTKRPLKKSRRNVNHVPTQNLSPVVDKPNDDTEIMSYLLVGIIAALVILYVIATGNFSNNIFCGGLLFFGLSAGIIIVLLINKNRS